MNLDLKNSHLKDSLFLQIFFIKVSANNVFFIIYVCINDDEVVNSVFC